MFADREGSFEVFPVDFEPLFGGLDAVETVAKPFRAADGAVFQVALKARCDFLFPVGGLAKENKGSGFHHPYFASYFF